VRKLAALEALSRYGKARGSMTGEHHHRAQPVAHQRGDRLDADPEARERRAAAPAAPGRSQQRAEGAAVYQGTKLIFSTEQDDYWWWLMTNGDVNTARLLLA
jgi:hypothetical protein